MFKSSLFIPSLPISPPTSDMAVTGLQKWPCPSCTYTNWSSSIKCVLCGCSRPNELTSRSLVVKYRPPVPGWSKLAHSQGSGGACPPADIICADFSNMQQTPSITMDLQPPNHHHNHNKGSGHGVKCKTKGKWTCGSCTFSNWPNAGQCTMCGFARSRAGLRHDPIISAGGRREVSRSPLLSESILNYASGVGGAVGGASYHGGSSDERAPPSSSQDLLLIQPVASKSKQNSRNGRRTSSQQQTDNTNVKKWRCHQCTYENWPRAVKCVMCQSLRRRTPSPPLSGGDERDNPGVQLSMGSVRSQPAVSRPASASSRLTPSSTTSSPSPVHSRSSSNSNEMAAASSQQRMSPDAPNTAVSSQKKTGGGGGNRVIVDYEHDSWSSLEIEPSAQLKSDSDEVNFWRAVQ